MSTEKEMREICVKVQQKLLEDMASIVIDLSTDCMIYGSSFLKVSCDDDSVKWEVLKEIEEQGE
jgi:hypothetical protein